jgi:RNA polymerase sigma-70 factor (ECF subfamily)
VAALEALPDGMRLAVYLADVEGMPYEEIADIMGSPIGAVRSRVHRGRCRLRQALEPYATARRLIRTSSIAGTGKQQVAGCAVVTAGPGTTDASVCYDARSAASL